MRKSLLVLALGGLAIMVLAPLGAQEESGKDFKTCYTAGNEAMDAGRWSEAIAQLTKAEGLAQTNEIGRSPAANCLGLAYMKQRQWDKAVGEFQRAVELNPQNKVALNNLGYSYMKMYDYGLGGVDQLKLAVEAYDKLAVVDPTYRPENRDLAKKMLADEEARTAKKNATPAAPAAKPVTGNGYKFWAQKGDEAEQAGDLESALQHYAKAEAQSNTSKHWAANRQGTVARKMHQLDIAISHFERAVSLSTAKPEAMILNNLGMAYTDLYDSGKAGIAELEKAVSALQKAGELDAKYVPGYEEAKKRLEQEQLWAQNAAAAAAAQATAEAGKDGKKKKK